jgi:hypothetical protein
VSTPAPRARPRPRRRRRRRGRILALLLGGVLLFAVGIALGQALHDNPSPSQDRDTVIRTLHPGTLPPEQATVTVTVGTP